MRRPRAGRQQSVTPAEAISPRSLMPKSRLEKTLVLIGGILFPFSMQAMVVRKNVSHESPPPELGRGRAALMPCLLPGPRQV